MKERKKPRVKLRLPLQVYLLYLLLVTFMCTGVTIARYMTTTTSSDLARVAAFSISASSDAPAVAQMDCAAETPQLSYTLTVTSESEVAVKYDVVITLSQALDGLSMTLDGKAPAVSGAVYTFTDVGQMNPGGGTNTHTLALSGDAAAITENMERSVTVVIHAEQLNEIE